jgi:phosphoribosylformylglycinamidine synthase subunit PurSL
MVYRLEMTPRAGVTQGTAKLIEQASQYFGLEIVKAEKSDVLTIKADISETEMTKIATEIVNPVLQDGIVGQLKERQFDWFIAVGFLPGVTDNVSRSAREAVADILGRSLTESEAIFSSREFFVTAPNLSRDEVVKIGQELLGNVLIESVSVLSFADWQANGAPENLPLIEDETSPEVHLLSLEESDADLETMSKEKTLALTLREMKIIQEYIRKASDDPKRKELGLEGKITDAELECLAQTWSEHCKHKIFDAIVNYTDENGKEEQITSLFKSYIKKSTEEISEEVDWLVSVFHDNAGVISFNDKYDLVYKAETHNSPSALDPYGGAMTGIVGVNRDPMGTGIGAELLINTWGYCLGSPFANNSDVPEGLLHPRRIRDGVHQGVIDGGNQSGIPYGLGWEYFDPRYIGKPLVYCGTVGLLPRQIHGQSGADKTIEPGDFVVMTGGRIGKDGIHGATFSSEELHKDSPVQAVQIGDPITQKKMYDFVMEARDLGLYRFVTDNGAGGLSSSIGEMSTQCGGCEMDLSKAPVKYAGLQPWEILVSEAQERMSFAVQPEKMEEFAALAAKRDVEISNLGKFTDSGKFHITYADKTVCYLDLDFMHDGLPRMVIPAKWDAPVHEEPELDDSDIADDIVTLLKSLNITSNEFKCRQYDHEVKGLSVVKPFVGVNSDVQTDASVFMPEPLTKEGIILSSGIAPGYSDIDTYHMMASVMDLAIRRTIAVGGKLGHMAGLDNFCWPDPVESEKTPDGQYKMAQLVRANKALYEYSKAFGVPLISGKDSMKNDSTKGGKKISIPPTVLYSTIAKMDNIEKSVTLSAKRSGDLVYIVGETKAELGGSQFSSLKGAIGNSVPKVDAEYAKSVYRALSETTEKELCHSIHTPALGGLAVGFAKVAIAGQLGLDVDLNKIPADDLSAQEILFSESNTRFIVTIAEESVTEFEKAFDGLPCACVGRVTLDDELVIRQGKHIEAAVSLGKLSKSYKTTLDNV